MRVQRCEGGGGAEGSSERQSLFQGTLQLCFFSLPLFTHSSLLSNSSCTPARLTTSSSSPPFRSWLLSLPLSLPRLSSSRKPFPLSYTAFLSSFLPSFHLVRSISGLKTINLLPLSLARGNFLHFSSYFRPPHATSQLLPPPPREDGMKAPYLVLVTRIAGTLS